MPEKMIVHHVADRDTGAPALFSAINPEYVAELEDQNSVLIEALRVMFRWSSSQFINDALNEDLAVSDDSPLGLVRRALKILKAKGE